MSLDGILYSVNMYSPCLECSDVYLVEAVCVAEDTDAVRRGLKSGDLPDVKCRVCGTTLARLPFVLCASDQGMTLWCALPGSSFDPATVSHLLLMGKARRQSWPAEDPSTLCILPRGDLVALGEGAAPLATDFAIPAGLWSQGPPEPLSWVGEERRREAWDQLVAEQGGLFDRVRTGTAARGEAGRDLIAGIGRRLALAHVRRFLALGEGSDLVAGRGAAALAMRIASTSRMRSSILGDVGAIAALQYERVGDLELAREAIAAYREAVVVDPDNTVAAAGLGATLSNPLLIRDDPSLINDSIATLRVAVEQSSHDGGDRAIRLNNLGSALSQRGAAASDVRDLADAAIALTQSLELTSEASPFEAGRHNNLGTAHYRAFRLEGGRSMLEAAIEQFEAAVATSAQGDPDLPGRQGNLASALWWRGARGDDERAEELSRSASTGRDADPDGALLAARNWCINAFHRQAWGEVLEAYDQALITSDLLLDRQVSTGARRTRLRDVQGLPELAAYAAAMLGDGLAMAQALEAGRGRLLADAFESAANGVEAARDADPRMAVRRTELVEALDRIDRSMDIELDPASRAAHAAEARTLRAQLTEVMTQINAMVGFAPPPPLQTIERVARRGPLIYVACTHMGTVASVVLAEPLTARLVWSEALTAPLVADLQSRLATEEGLDDALTTVGRLLAAPIDAILATRTANSAGLLTLSLPAALARLPIGAAPFAASGEIQRLVDNYAVAYVPAAFAAAQPVRVEARTQLGGVANPARAGLDPLQYASAELRAAALHLPADDRDILIGAAATVDEVITVIDRCSHIHFACHGMFTPDSPLDSCLRLTDGDLSLRRIQRVARSTSLRLVVLSACESGQADSIDLPDEIVGLPTALLQLGAQTVVGSLWPVPDLPTYLLMDRFYRSMDIDGLAPEYALRVAQNWLRTANLGAVVEMLEAAQDEGPDGILVGIAARVLQSRFGEDERPFSSTSIWAGFVAFGGQQEGRFDDRELVDQ